MKIKRCLLKSRFSSIGLTIFLMLSANAAAQTCPEAAHSGGATDDLAPLQHANSKFLLNDRNVDYYVANGRLGNIFIAIHDIPADQQILAGERFVLIGGGNQTSGVALSDEVISYHRDFLLPCLDRLTKEASPEIIFHYHLRQLTDDSLEDSLSKSPVQPILIAQFTNIRREYDEQRNLIETTIPWTPKYLVDRLTDYQKANALSLKERYKLDDEADADRSRFSGVKSIHRYASESASAMFSKTPAGLRDDISIAKKKIDNDFAQDSSLKAQWEQCETKAMSLLGATDLSWNRVYLEYQEYPLRYDQYAYKVYDAKFADEIVKCADLKVPLALVAFGDMINPMFRFQFDIKHYLEPPKVAGYQNPRNKPGYHKYFITHDTKRLLSAMNFYAASTYAGNTEAIKRYKILLHHLIKNMGRDHRPLFDTSLSALACHIDLLSAQLDGSQTGECLPAGAKIYKSDFLRAADKQIKHLTESLELINNKIVPAWRQTIANDQFTKSDVLFETFEGHQESYAIFSDACGTEQSVDYRSLECQLTYFLNERASQSESLAKFREVANEYR